MTDTVTQETIGLGGYPAAGVLGETPELVGFDRSKGYPYLPFAVNPDRFFTGASSVGKAVGDDWSWWARRVCARVGAKMRKELAEFRNAKDAERALYSAADQEQWGPANDGSSVHLYTALEDAGRHQTVDLPGRLTGHLEAWREFKRRNGVRVGAIERTGYAPTFATGVAGTIDRLIVAETRDDIGPHELIVCDLKTKSQPLSKVKTSIEHLIQIVALAQSTQVAIEEQRVMVDLPPIVRGVIVYLCRDGYRAQWIDPHQPELLDLADACVRASAGKKAIGSGAFGTPEVHPMHNSQPELVDPPPTENGKVQQ